MSNFRRTVRQTLTVARRDFVATVFTPTFLIFLLAPLISVTLALATWAVVPLNNGWVIAKG